MLASSRRWYARRDAGLSGRWARPARAIVRAMSTDPDLQLAVVWLRNDLRVRDNAALRAAADLCTQGAASHALPVYTLNPRTFGTTRWGNPKTGPYRAQFLIESVLDLKQRLRDLGSGALGEEPAQASTNRLTSPLTALLYVHADLLVAVGHPEDVFARLAGPARSLVVLTQEEVTSEELRDDERVRSALGSRGELRRVRGHTLVHRDDLPLAADLVDMPDVFTQFRKRVEAAMRVRDESPQLRPGELQLPPEEYFTSTGLSLAFEPALSDLPTPVPFARCACNTLAGAVAHTTAQCEQYQLSSFVAGRLLIPARAWPSSVASRPPWPAFTTSSGAPTASLSRTCPRGTAWWARTTPPSSPRGSRSGACHPAWCGGRSRHLRIDSGRRNQRTGCSLSSSAATFSDTWLSSMATGYSSGMGWWGGAEQRGRMGWARVQQMGWVG